MREGRQWVVCFAGEVRQAEKRIVHTAVGIDVGLTDLATLSTGVKIPSLRAARKAERKLRLAQRALARKKRGSNRRVKARERVAGTHRKIRAIRNTYAHQVTAGLAREYDLIAVEALKVRNMIRNRHLARSIADASWSDLIAKLRYKAERAGATLVEVDPKFTSQLCSGCGEMVQKPLARRWHSCPLCGTELDRDVNAALNILERGYEAVVGLAARKLEVAPVAPRNLVSISK